MKKTRLISIILIITILFTSIAVLAEDEKEETKQSAYDAGYIKGQEDKGDSIKMPSFEQIKNLYDGKYKDDFLEGYIKGFIDGKSTYGKTLGSKLGEIEGETDFRKGYISDWQRNFPNDNEIIEMYNLKIEPKDYQIKFLEEFKESYRESYLKAFEEANLKPVADSAEKGKADGLSIGSSLGDFFGKKDAEENKNIDYNRHLPDDSVIVKNYNLEKDTKEYREAFITYFKISFREGYEKTYRETNIGNINEAAEKDGHDKGYDDGKAEAESYKRLNQLKPYNMIKPTEKKIKDKFKEYLASKNEAYIKDFIEGYLDGFKKGYEEIIGNESMYQDGYSKGYSDGKSLAAKSNADKTFISYEKAKLTDAQITTSNYETLKDKSKDYILLFVDGYRKGFEVGYKEVIKAGEDTKTPEAISAGFGASFGMMYGEMAGIRDYEGGNRPDWSRAMPSNSEINSLFDLRSLPYHERDKFIEQFEINFEIGYGKAYYNAHFGKKKASMETGKTDGTTFGSMVGKVFGAKDYYEGKDSDFNRNMPSEGKISVEYSLNKDNADYTRGFINGFKNAYEEAYLSGFREAKNSAKVLEDSSAYENGLAIGQTKGEIQASMDHMMKASNDWERSQPLSSSIISEYNLMYQTTKYRDSFINGFWDGYSKGYTENYKQLSQDSAINKTTSQTVPIAGGNIESLGGGFAVEVDPGIYYKPVILNIDNLNGNYSIDSRYISASDYYRVSMLNPSGASSKDKKIKISFEYYGDKDGGIYVLDENKWYYLTSTIEDGVISTYVNPSAISANGNIFGVLVDKETEVFYDIRGHWAKDEITAYIRRDVISGYPDKTFKPDQYITRAEFLVLLGRLYEWYLPYDTSNTKFFKDQGTFNKFSIKHIGYGLSHNYIIGYPDKYFRPYNNITYKEVDIIMKRVLNDFNFRWSKYAEKMMYDKKIRSSSYDSYDNRITRAEFSYMLYNLYQWKY